MGVSRATVWMLQANEVQFIDTPERSETWIVKDGVPHALMLSCPHDKRPEMEAFVTSIKSEESNGTQIR